jgi:DNA helicase-2/ATP-dependent DNA helicase PcrA
MTVRLTPAQQQVVNHDQGALLVVAGPGSGKTRVLTERVRRLLADPNQHFRILALTFTNKAANEMVERLENVPDIRKRAFVGTLHSFCMEVLANRGKPVGVEGLPNIFESFEDRKQILANAVRADPTLLTLLRESGDLKEQQRTLSRWLERVSELKNSLVLPIMLDDDSERRIYEAYDSELRASAALDYDDLLLLTYRLFQDRPRIADFYRRQYAYICIDEGQDLNEAQYRLISTLCGQDFRNIMMVGDPKQAIYVWNGADPKYLDFFRTDFNAKSITLSENFRCSKAVVAAARRLDPSYSVEGQLPIDGLVDVIPCPDEQSEASAVVATLEGLIEHGHPDIEGEVTPERCAVLGRNRFVFAHVEAELSNRGWPYFKKLSAAGYQSESAIVEQFELALRLLANPVDRLHLALLAKEWKAQKPVEVLLAEQPSNQRNGLALLQHLAASAQGEEAAIVIDAVQAMQWTEQDFKLLNGLDKIEQHANTLQDEERATILQDTREWRKHWDYYVRSEPGGTHGVGSFLGQVALGTTQQPNEQGIALLTVHSAKGMEFDVVVLIGMTEGTFPDYRAKGPALMEEQRSAFVAATRSKRLLYLTYPASRIMPWGAVRVQQPSRYVNQIRARK